MRTTLLVAIAFILAPNLLMAASPPKPSKSEYLVSTSAGFVMTEERGVYYSVRFSIRKPLGGPTYATIDFPNPESSASEFKNDLFVPAEATEILAESPRLTTLRHDARYRVTVRLFRDEARTILLTTHVQDVLFSVPARFEAEIEARYGVRIL